MNEADQATLERVKEAFQTVERWQKYIDANNRQKEVASRLASVKTSIARIKEALDDREDEIRTDPAFEERLAGKNDTERKAKLAKVVREDETCRALKAELMTLENERDTLTTEVEGLKGDVGLYQTVAAEVGALLAFAAAAAAHPQAAKAFLA